MIFLPNERHTSTLAFPEETLERGRCHNVAEGVRAVRRVEKEYSGITIFQKTFLGGVDAPTPSDFQNCCAISPATSPAHAVETHSFLHQNL